jgi:phospholipase/carboxylesterase
MYFLSHIPEDVTPETKCIILLHGVGSNEADLFELKDSLDPDALIYSLRWPFSLWGGRYAWYPVDFGTGKPVYKTDDVDVWYREIVSLIDDIQEKYHLSTENIYLMGFSQGAIISYYTLISAPEKVGGVIWLSGRLLVELRDFVLSGRDYSAKRVFVGHGTADTIIPVDAVSVVEGFLQSHGIVTEMHKYNSGHTITFDELWDIRNWLKSNKI